MRISDWSSDVCSSDLAGVAEAPDFPDEAARFGFGVAGHIGFQPDDIEPPSDERAQPREQPMLEIGREAVDRAEQIVGQHRIIKIGRTSCRERVCQYV